jgi:hypothetical protein
MFTLPASNRLTYPQFESSSSAHSATAGLPHGIPTSLSLDIFDLASMLAVVSSVPQFRNNALADSRDELYD